MQWAQLSGHKLQLMATAFQENSPRSHHRTAAAQGSNGLNGMLKSGCYMSKLSTPIHGMILMNCKISRNRRRGQAVKPKNPPEPTKKPPPSKLTLEEYISWMTLSSNDNTIITPVYGHLDEAESILADSWIKGQKQYLVQWKPTPCRDKHNQLHEIRIQGSRHGAPRWG